ncbi:MAG: PDGLE domain-containing protein [Thermosynechococcaceae cyanobacterium]
MNHKRSPLQSRAIVLGGLGISLLIAVCLSPFASQHPDGLDRVSADLKFNTREAPEKPAKKLPFYTIFNEYALRGVPEQLATPLAGLIGTLATFGLAWGMGKLLIRGSSHSTDTDTPQSE